MYVNPPLSRQIKEQINITTDESRAGSDLLKLEHAGKT